MTAKTRIGMICDMHLPDDKASPQYAFLQRAVKRMKEDGVNIVICLGDITSYGEIGAWELYCEALKDFKHYEVAGNSDVRDALTRTELLSAFSEAEFSIGSRRVLGINTPDGEISAKDRERLMDMKAGDIVFMHHYIQSMKPESGEWLKALAESTPLIILHGHGHKKFDYYIGNTHVMGLRPLDPDKAFGDYPCINYLDVSDEEVSVKEVLFPLPKEYLEDVAKYFGLSCVDNEKDVNYAIEHSIKYVELRCNGSDWKPDMSLLPILESWRKKTHGYLSVHMPNLHYEEGVISGKERWLEAIDYAITVGAESLTIHPPRISIADMQENSKAWCELLELYVHAAKCIPKETRIGIENLHKGKKEKLDEYRKFGYTPQEVTAWIDAINNKLGEERVGHVLDVGHARNNGAFTKKYTSSKWYQMMGKKAIAYHIHQVLPTSNGLKNHNAIENWFGPEINYTSFFYAWHHNLLNHAPVFLEVKGSENFKKSIAAFELLKKLKMPLDYARATIHTMMRENELGHLEEKKTSFNYHMGVFLHGVYSNYELCKEEVWFDFIKEWVDSLVDEEGNILGVFRNRMDDFQAGNLLYPLYKKSGKEKYKLALDKLMNLMDNYPKNREGGFWHMERFPNQMWLDGLYMGGPLICKYAHMFGQPKYFDIAAFQALLMQEKTRDAKSGLWYHAYDCERIAEWADKDTGCSPEFWGRSLGWVPIAILEELDYIPPEHSKYKALCQLVKDLLIALCKFQQEDGRWYQVVDKAGRTGNWPETSCSCLFVAALCKAVRKNIIDETYLKDAWRGYEGVIKNLTWSGEFIEINDVCVGTGVGNYEYYCNRKKCTNDLHGVGAFLLMCSEVHRIL